MASKQTQGKAPKAPKAPKDSKASKAPKVATPPPPETDDEVEELSAQAAELFNWLLANGFLMRVLSEAFQLSDADPEALTDTVEDIGRQLAVQLEGYVNELTDAATSAVDQSELEAKLAAQSAEIEALRKRLAREQQVKAVAPALAVSKARSGRSKTGKTVTRTGKNAFPNGYARFMALMGKKGGTGDAMLITFTVKSSHEDIKDKESKTYEAYTVHRASIPADGTEMTLEELRELVQGLGIGNATVVASFAWKCIGDEDHQRISQWLMGSCACGMYLEWLDVPEEILDHTVELGAPSFIEGSKLSGLDLPEGQQTLGSLRTWVEAQGVSNPGDLLWGLLGGDNDDVLTILGSHAAVLAEEKKAAKA